MKRSLRLARLARGNAKASRALAVAFGVMLTSLGPSRARDARADTAPSTPPFAPPLPTSAPPLSSPAAVPSDAAVSTASSPAQSPQDAANEARQEYNAGALAYGAKRFVEAALHFEAAAAQRAHAVTLYTAALAWEQSNRPERAADDYARALDVPGLTAAQTTNARERLVALEKTLGTLEVAARPGDRVQLDALTEVSAPAKLHATAGVHVLTLRAPGRSITKRDVSLDLGRTGRFDVATEAPRDGASPTTEPAGASGARGGAGDVRAAAPLPAPATFDLRRALGVGVLGAGVATLGAALVLWRSALDARDAYDASPSRAAFDHASSLETWTNVAIGGGTLMAAGGALLAFWPAAPHRGDTSASFGVGPTAGGAVLRGSF